MSDDQTLDRAKRFTEALHAVDAGGDGAVDAMVKLYAPDARLMNAALDLNGETRDGHEGAHAFWSAYAQQFDTAETTFHHVTADGAAGGLFWTTKGKSPEGDPLEYHGASLLVFDDEGLVSSFRGYYDTRQLTLKTHGG